MDFLTSSLLCLLLTMFLFQALNSFRNGRKSSGSNFPPGPRRLPIIGNLLDLGDKPHRSLAKLAQIHGPVMSLQLGSLFTVVVSTETTAKEVLQKQDLVFCNRTVVDAARACQFREFGLSFMPVSPLWRTLRKVCVIHLFSTLKLDANQYLRRRKIQELIGNVRKRSLEGEAIDVGQAAFDVSINLLSNTIFSMDLVDPKSSHAQELKKTVWDINHDAGIPNLADYFPLLRKIDPQGIRRRMTVHFDKLLTL
ncbi:cytochrome P450, family 76, subfamily C, polypeptide 1 [Hibiscus trionum]|uniref:Cytochrome P450, family 76, subfamily C, polypeptide 1 n=1 Tax=Hibiscus trionum TaxID=183268 RepID=A0A9W7J681_HIBTR|nr:cytochrome P450, family 76, subfamily C, polypeptide 1 [Hibiscus trionum]